MKRSYSSPLCYNNFPTQTDAGDKIVYDRFPKNPETQQEYQKIRKTTEISFALSKNISW